MLFPSFVSICFFFTIYHGVFGTLEEAFRLYKEVDVIGPLDGKSVNEISEVRSQDIVSRYHGQNIGRRAIFLDYDNTLTRSGKQWKEANDRIVFYIRKLAADGKTDLYIVSQRPIHSLHKKFGGDQNIIFVGEAGSAVKLNQKAFSPLQLAKLKGDRLETLVNIINKEIESKDPEHFYTPIDGEYGHALTPKEPYEGQYNADFFSSLSEEIQNSLPKELKSLRVRQAGNFITFQDDAVTKGGYLNYLFSTNAQKKQYYDFILVMGDEDADESMYKAVQTWARRDYASIIVQGAKNPERSIAQARISSHQQVADLFEKLTEGLYGAGSSSH